MLNGLFHLHEEKSTGSKTLIEVVLRKRGNIDEKIQEIAFYF